MLISKLIRIQDQEPEIPKNNAPNAYLDHLLTRIHHAAIVLISLYINKSVACSARYFTSLDDAKNEDLQCMEIGFLVDKIDSIKAAAQE